MAAHLANGETGLEVRKHIFIRTAADERGKLTAPRLFVGGGAEVDGKDAELCGVGCQKFLQQLEEVADKKIGEHKAMRAAQHVAGLLEHALGADVEHAHAYLQLFADGQVLGLGRCLGYFSKHLALPAVGGTGIVAARQ